MPARLTRRAHQSPFLRSPHGAGPPCGGRVPLPRPIKWGGQGCRDYGRARQSAMSSTSSPHASSAISTLDGPSFRACAAETLLDSASSPAEFAR
eukprot:scaffold295659_cov30-Tisochrysis_lutea.AAC.2